MSNLRSHSALIVESNDEKRLALAAQLRRAGFDRANITSVKSYNQLSFVDTQFSVAIVGEYINLDPSGIKVTSGYDILVSAPAELRIITTPALRVTIPEHDESTGIWAFTNEPISVPLVENDPSPALEIPGLIELIRAEFAPKPQYALKFEKPRILLIESNPTTRSVLISLLERGGYEFATANGVTEAQNILDGDTSFGMVITSYKVDHRFGPDVFPHPNCPNNKIIIVDETGETSPSDYVGNHNVKVKLRRDLPQVMQEVDQLAGRSSQSRI